MRGSAYAVGIAAGLFGVWLAVSGKIGFTAELADVSSWLAPHRQAWYALPLVVAAYVVLGFGLFPVMLLIAGTGLAFGPALGPAYAMAGCLASASAGFAVGRWLGPRQVERFGGERVARLVARVRRNGTLTVFLIRKVPMPFTLVNVALGASTITYRDFLIGTLLGMTAVVVAVAGFGYHVAATWRSPSLTSVLTGALFVAVPLTLAWAINRRLRSQESPA